MASNRRSRRTRRFLSLFMAIWMASGATDDDDDSHRGCNAREVSTLGLGSWVRNGRRMLAYRRPDRPIQPPDNDHGVCGRLLPGFSGHHLRETHPSEDDPRTPHHHRSNSHFTDSPSGTLNFRIRVLIYVSAYSAKYASQ